MELEPSHNSETISLPELNQVDYELKPEEELVAKEVVRKLNQLYFGTENIDTDIHDRLGNFGQRIRNKPNFQNIYLAHILFRSSFSVLTDPPKIEAFDFEGEDSIADFVNNKLFASPDDKPDQAMATTA